MLLVGCQNKNEISFGTLNLSNENEIDAPLVVVNVPNALKDTKLAVAINTSIKEEILALLIFEENSPIHTINEAANSFKKEFFAVKEKFPGHAARWEVKVNGAVLFENDKLVTIALESYVFTGGAHGYLSTTFLNFDKVKGRQLKKEELFSDMKAFERLAELRFRTQEEIPEDVPINDTGFMFEEEEYRLPLNIGYTKNGIKLLYNAYEVASYADGQIEFSIPYTEANSLLKIKVGQ